MLEKCLTGIVGFDDVTGGGVPKGRSTLVCGGPGSGKTMLAVEFLVRGATEYGEPGVLVTFEESESELAANFISLGVDLEDLVAQRKIIVDQVELQSHRIEEAGAYDLEALFIRVGHALDAIGAKRVAVDSLETLFASLSDAAMLRSELRRLFSWLKERGVTAVVTGERGEGALTRHGLEEYISDCVVLLDHRMIQQVATRRLRIVKYRGAAHGLNEYPFMISEHGIEVIPITSMMLDYPCSTERISTGVPRLDEMLGGQGYFRGSAVLVSGAAGTGKTSIASHFADAACRRGERCSFFIFEESRGQLIRNMRSIGVDLEPWVAKGLLRFHAARPTLCGLEPHLAAIRRHVVEFDPRVVVLDPISGFEPVGDRAEIKALLERIVDFLKSRLVTALLTSLTRGGDPRESSAVGMSSLIDTWLLVREIEQRGERIRGLYVIKSRGMAHASDIREIVFTERGLDLATVIFGPDGVLTGSARRKQEALARGAAAPRKPGAVRADGDRRQGARGSGIDASSGGGRARGEQE